MLVAYVPMNLPRSRLGGDFHPGETKHGGFAENDVLACEIP